MKGELLEKREKIKSQIQNMREKDILDLLKKAFTFKEEPQIVFFTKEETKITGYLEINNKLLFFEIWYSTIDNNMTITIENVWKKIKYEEEVEKNGN